jgi:hypothetical protein
MRTLVSGLLMLVIAGSALHAARHVLDDEGPRWRARLDEERRRSEELDAAFAERREFAARLDDLLGRFERRQATLAQTVQAIEQFAAVQRPEHLVWLMDLESGDTIAEKIAQNVVRHFRQRHSKLNTSMTRQLLAYAEQELAAFLQHDHQGAASLH